MTERSPSSDLLSTPYRFSLQRAVMEIGARIKEARETTGMTQRDVAKKLQVSPSAVAQWETNATVPTIENRADLSRLLKIPFMELVPEAGNLVDYVVKDPQILAIVEQLIKLPPPVREAILMQTAATAQALEGRSGPDTPDE